MRALFDNAAVVQHNNLVGVPDGREAVRNHHDRLLLKQPFEPLHDCSLIVRVERVGRLVEKEVFRSLVSRPGNQKPLLLSDAQSVAVGSNLGVVTQRKLADEGVNVGDTRGTAHPLHVGTLVRNADVTRNGVGEDIPLLHHRAASLPPARGAVLSNAAVAQQHLPRRRSIVAQQQLQHRSLPRAARPHDGRHLMRRDCDRHVVQCLGRVRPVVLKRHAPELQVG